MKVNLDLTAAAPENLISDELQNNVGSSAFNLEHDFFYGGTELEIWTSSGQTGTQLVEDTDYTLGGVDSNLTDRAGRDVYTTVTVTNATYQTGNLYFTYQAAADYVDATDRYLVRRASSQYFELTSGGGFDLYTTSNIVFDSSGDLSLKDQYLASAINISESGTTALDGSFTATSIVGALNELKTSASSTSLDDAYNNGSSITVDTGDVDWNLGSALDFRVYDASDADKFVITQGTGANSVSANTSGGINLASSLNSASAIVLNSSAGGLDLDAGSSSGAGGVVITSSNNTTGTGNDVTLESVNASSGTGGDVVISTTATSGTAGSILFQTADTTPGTTRISIGSNGDTILYGTASTTGALPVVTLDQADIDEPFMKFIGDAAAVNTTNDLVAEGEVTTATRIGFLKIEIQDDGNQITDGDYYVPFFEIS